MVLAVEENLLAVEENLLVGWVDCKWVDEGVNGVGGGGSGEDLLVAWVDCKWWRWTW